MKATNTETGSTWVKLTTDITFLKDGIDHKISMFTHVADSKLVKPGIQPRHFSDHQFNNLTDDERIQIIETAYEAFEKHLYLTSL